MFKLCFETFCFQVRNLSERSKEKVVGKVMEDIFNEKGISLTGGSAQLKSGGLPRTVAMGKGGSGKPDSPQFSFESITSLQNSKGFSDSQTVEIAKFMRYGAGKKMVEPNFAKKLTERNHALDDYFEVTNFEMKKKVKNTKGKQLTESDEMEKVDNGYISFNREGVKVKDFKEWTEKIITNRNIEEDKVVIQLGFDDGQDILKLMQTVKTVVIPNENSKEKRRKYSEGYDGGNSPLSSVKKLFVICAVPKVDETYDNVKTILEKVDLSGVSFGMSCDLKMCLCLCGKQAASSKHPCPFCHGVVPFEEEAERTTIGSLNKLYLEYIEAGAVLKNAKDFKNVTRKPLLCGDPDELVMDKINLPELHIMTGVTGKLIKEMECKCFESQADGRKFIDKFLHVNNIQRCVYQGSESFEGNQARKILKVMSIIYFHEKVQGSTAGPKQPVNESYKKSYFIHP